MGKIVDKFVSSELDKCPGDRRLCQGCSLWTKERRKTGRAKRPVQHRQPKIEQVCGTCADWKTCPHTEGWRIRQSCSRESGCYWKPAQLRAGA